MKWERNLRIKKDKKFLVTKSTYILNITLVLFVLNFLSNNFTITNIEFLQISAIYLLLAILILNIPLRKIYNKLKQKKIEKNSFYLIFVGIFLIIFSFVLIIAFKNVLLWLVSIPLFILGLDLSLKGIKIKREDYRCF